MTSDPQANRDGWSEPTPTDDTEPPPTQPPSSPIEIKRFDDGVSINVPPVGLWRSGLFIFGLVWSGFLLFFTAIVVPATLNSNPQEGIWLIALILSVFWLAGIGMLLAGINMGRRQAGLAVAGGTLMVLQTGLFGKRQREWPLAEVTAIRVGRTGLVVNDEPVMELQIHDSDGDKLGLLAGRTDEELAWLASELRKAAGVREYGSTNSGRRGDEMRHS